MSVGGKAGPVCGHRPEDNGGAAAFLFWHRAALREAVRFRDGLWTEVAAEKSSEQLKKWVADWTEDKDEASEDGSKKQ